MKRVHVPFSAMAEYWLSRNHGRPGMSRLGYAGDLVSSFSWISGLNHSRVTRYSYLSPVLRSRVMYFHASGPMPLMRSRYRLRPIWGWVMIFHFSRMRTAGLGKVCPRFYSETAGSYGSSRATSKLYEKITVSFSCSGPRRILSRPRNPVDHGFRSPSRRCRNIWPLKLQSIFMKGSRWVSWDFPLWVGFITLPIYGSRVNPMPTWGVKSEVIWIVISIPPATLLWLLFWLTLLDREGLIVFHLFLRFSGRREGEEDPLVSLSWNFAAPQRDERK